MESPRQERDRARELADEYGDVWHVPCARTDLHGRGRAETNYDVRAGVPAPRSGR